MGRSFAIYCSAGASRVLKFYGSPRNRSKLGPRKVIYDGGDTVVASALRDLFGDDLVVLDTEALSEAETKRIHATTSSLIHRTLVRHGIEYLLCFGNRILKGDLIDDFVGKLVNFHPSILPSFKGLGAIDQAREDRVSFLGNTAHYIDRGIDTGEVIVQSAMLASDFDDYEDVLELQFPMMKLVLRDLLEFDVSDAEVFAELSHRTKNLLMPDACGRE